MNDMTITGLRKIASSTQKISIWFKVNITCDHLGMPESGAYHQATKTDLRRLLKGLNGNARAMSYYDEDGRLIIG